MFEQPKEAFPLTWPQAQPRTPLERRIDATYKFKQTFGKYRDDLMESLRKLGARDVIVSSNIPTRDDGLPYANAREPADPAVAIYFKRKGRPFVLACDRYRPVKANLRALGLVVEALRDIERHGSPQLLEQAFTGFAALPPARAAEPSWWETLGVQAHTPTNEIRAAYHTLAQKHHPDKGGEHETMARINRAYDRALEERGETRAE